MKYSQPKPAVKFSTAFYLTCLLFSQSLLCNFLNHISLRNLTVFTEEDPQMSPLNFKLYFHCTIYFLLRVLRAPGSCLLLLNDLVFPVLVIAAAAAISHSPFMNCTLCPPSSAFHKDRYGKPFYHFIFQSSNILPRSEKTKTKRLLHLITFNYIVFLLLFCSIQIQMSKRIMITACFIHKKVQ